MATLEERRVSLPPGRLTLGRSVRDTTKGRYPSIAVSNTGVVVEVSQDHWPFKSIYYRVGTLKLDPPEAQGSEKITWGEKVWDGDAKILYGKGRYPRVAINDLGTVVAIHEDDNDCVVCVGFVPTETGARTLTWRETDKNPLSAETAMNIAKPTTILRTAERKFSLPSVALKNNENKAIATFENKGRLYYSVGTSNANNIQEKDFQWSKPARLHLDKPATELTISVNSVGDVVVAYRKRRRMGLYFSIGKLHDGSPCTIEMSRHTEENYDWGYSPVISINKDGLVVAGNQTAFGRRLHFWTGNVHITKGLPYEKDPAFKGGYGYLPSIAINDNNQVVEVHETNFSLGKGNTLWHRTGLLEALPQAERQPSHQSLQSMQNLTMNNNITESVT